MHPKIEESPLPFSMEYQPRQYLYQPDTSKALFIDPSEEEEDQRKTESHFCEQQTSSNSIVDT